MPDGPKSLRPKPMPHRRNTAQAEARRREERLAAALKANLARRKRQSRGRADAAAATPAGKPGG